MQLKPASMFRPAIYWLEPQQGQISSLSRYCGPLLRENHDLRAGPGPGYSGRWIFLQCWNSADRWLIQIQMEARPLLDDALVTKALVCMPNQLRCMSRLQLSMETGKEELVTKDLLPQNIHPGEETTKQPGSRPVLNVSIQEEIGSNSASNSPAVLASAKSQVLVPS